MNNIEKYSSLFPYELKSVIEYMPKDEIDWALIMYLFRHTNKGNVITLGKISSYFQLDKEDVLNRIYRMTWLINQCINLGYPKTFITCELSNFGADILVKLVETLEVKPRRVKMNI